MAKIVIVDDDMSIDMLADNLRYRGHEASRIGSAEQAIAEIKSILYSDLIILDIIMPWPVAVERNERAKLPWSGMEIFREIRAQNKDIPIIVYSAIKNQDLEDILSDDPRTIFIAKWNSPSIKEFVKRVHEMLGIDVPRLLPVSFIVHGRDETTKLAVKNYLQNYLNLPEPIILHEKPNQGRTIIEKFEDYAAQSCIVFVLLTPDDIGAKTGDDDNSKRRARQNVIFEMGYFLGLLGRRSGQVLLLHKGPLELPSDIAGVVYIDITNGIEAAGEEIRREVAHVTGT